MKRAIEIRTLGDLVQFYLFDRHMSYRELQKIIGMSVSTVSRIVNGEDIQARWIIPLAKWCDITPQELWDLLDETLLNERLK